MTTGAGANIQVPDVQVRTGDTPQSERARMQRHPPDILITTPESLYLLLSSSARAMLATVETVIVDEIHSLVPTKRGAHLFLSLERLEALRNAHALEQGHKHGAPPLQRIGLSATQRPLDEVARLLGGLDAHGKPRPVTIVDASEPKKLDISVEVPDVDMARLGEIDELASGPAAGGQRRSIWPHLHEKLVKVIGEHRSTMVFVNSRRLAERLASALNELAGKEIALAHHGSVAREKRALIEDRLKRGDLPAIVATSSLELGIDMGAVDLVVQIEAPPSIASGLQRIGRAGHSVGATSKGILFPKHRADLLACAAAIPCMREGAVEETFYPRSPLDVAAQQMVAIVASEGANGVAIEALWGLLRRAAPFSELPRGAFEGLLDMLSGRYPSDEFAELKPRLTWDRVGGVIRAREGALRLAIANGGTIPDRGLYGVFLQGGDEKKGGSRRVGELDEEMVFELREGDVFLLGASSWRVDEISLDQVLVVPAAGEPGKMPFWHGDRPGRSRAFGTAIGELSRKIAKNPGAGVKALLDRGLDASAAQNCAAYVLEQVEACGEVPSDKTVVIERFLDEIGDWRVCVLTPFGARVHAPWATAVVARLRAEHGGEADAVWSDDGIAFRIMGTSEPPKTELFLPQSDEVEAVVTASLGQSSLFAARFRENAARALLLPRRHPGKRTPLWAQRKRASDLLSVASRYPSFPILLETYRECLRDVFDLPGLVEILSRIESRRTRVVTLDADKPSPYAASLLFAFVANFIYDGDAPLAERRAQALTIDHAQLRELLGEAELRTLLDPDVIAEHELMLQRLVYKVKHADGVHDLLLSIGDLSLDEIASRLEVPANAATFLRELEQTRRVIAVRIHGEPRYAAAEDAARLRDALGVMLPRGLPGAFLEKVKDPLGDLIARYARTHGPFTESDVARRFGLGDATVALALEALVRSQRVVEGAFLRHGSGRELCDQEVLRALRRKALARLRQEVEPVEPAAFGRFLPDWQGVGRRRHGPDALLAVVAQLEGCPLPASVLEREILPLRIDDFKPWDLDALCAAGEVVWAGIESIGPHDGRIALYLADHEALLALPARPVEGEVAAKLRALLARRGAVFFAEIAREVGGFGGEIVDVLWDMVWSGEVTNDTLEPLRSYLRTRGGEKTRADRRPSSPPLRRARTSAGPPGTEGRWSLRASRWYEAPNDTARRTALTRSLLERYGVVTREAAHAEGIVGGFSAVYDVLKAMEESGKIRRGYFLAGRGATQFALPGADDRLRSLRTADEAPKTFLLAATDPANPYGAALPWPDADRGADGDGDGHGGEITESISRPQRSAGARVILHDGALVGWLGKSAETLLTFLPKDEPARGVAERALADALATLVDSGRRKALLVTTIDGIAAAHSPLANAMTRAGFQLASTGLLRRRTLDFDRFGQSERGLA
jgi:ATP-dependent Lhr-like helicase